MKNQILKIISPFIAAILIGIPFYYQSAADDFQPTYVQELGTSATSYVIDANNEAGPGNTIDLVFGQALNKKLGWDISNSRFVFSNNLRIEGNNSIIGQLYLANDHSISDSNGILNLGLNNSIFESISWDDANDSFLFSDDLDMNLNQLLKARIQNLSSAPTCDSGSRGRMYHNTTDNKSYVCNGTAFEQMGGSASSFGWVDDGTVVRLTTSTDQVGIGTAAPQSLLHLAAPNPVLFVKGTGANDYASTLRIAGEAGDDWQGGYIQYDGTGNNLVIGVHNTADKLTSSDIESIAIQRATGNVGIGTDNPSMKLDIQGTGAQLNLGDGTANDSIIRFDDGASRDFGWDDSEDAFSTFNQQFAFRAKQGASPPISCSSTVAGMLWFDTDTGMLYACDTSNSRNKWLSTQDIVIAGENVDPCESGNYPNNDFGCMVKWGDGLGPDTATDLGFFIPHPITITGYSFSMDYDRCTSGSFDVEVWGTGSNTDDNTYSFIANVITGLTGEAHNAGNLNVDINGGQYIIWGIDNNCGQTIDDYNIIFYFRWRHD